jgi:hypothetical protein
MGKTMGFKCKGTEANTHKQNGDLHPQTEEPTVASLVRDALARSPNGLLAPEISRSVASDIEKIGGKMTAIGAALYNMKKRGKLAHDENSGRYTLVKPT